MKHKHHDVIVAWAEGKRVEVYSDLFNKWLPMDPNNVSFETDRQYRIKPKIEVGYFFTDNFEGYNKSTGEIGGMLQDMPHLDIGSMIKLTYHNGRVVDVEFLEGYEQKE